MSVSAVAMVLLVCWAAILIGVVVVVARRFAKWGRDDDEADAKRRRDDQAQDAKGHGPP